MRGGCGRRTCTREAADQKTSRVNGDGFLGFGNGIENNDIAVLLDELAKQRTALLAEHLHPAVVNRFDGIGRRVSARRPVRVFCIESLSLSLGTCNILCRTVCHRRVRAL